LSIYVQGDFTKSLDYFNDGLKEYTTNSGVAGSKNLEYDVLLDNCLLESMSALRLGILSDGTLATDFNREIHSIENRPNTRHEINKKIFMNTAFTHEEYVGQITAQVDEFNNWYDSQNRFVKWLYKIRYNEINDAADSLLGY
jgi:hypothetical protein